MSTNQIEKIMKKAAAEGMSFLDLGRLLGGAPYHVLPPDATKIMDDYRKRFPGIHKPRPTAISTGLVQVAAAVCKPDSPAGESNYQPSILNRSAVKSYALAVSKETRGGKFNRVSVDFLKGVEAEVEAEIRTIGGSKDSEDISGEWDFLNRKQVRPKVEEMFNLAVRKIILRKVRNHPSLGKTLK